MQRTVQELNGEPWLELQEAAPMAKQVMSSDSFGQRVESLQELKEAISYHAANAAQRLRKQGLFASAVSVFIQNSPFDQAAFYGRTETVVLPAPTECNLQITQCRAVAIEKDVSARGLLPESRRHAVGVGPRRRAADRLVRILIHEQQIRQADGYRR
jgi:DNA polymerase V